MTKYNFEFYDLEELISHFSANVNYDINDVFADFKILNPFLVWCKHHGIDPHRTKTQYKMEVIDQWRTAEDRTNFYPPFVPYNGLIYNQIRDVNKFGIGTIDLNTFKDDINKAIGISEWPIYWKKYEGVVYSLNESFVSMFLPISVGGILTVFDSEQQLY